jgi:hypothetical protein
MGNNFLNRTQKAQHLSETMNKWGVHQTKEFLHSKGKSPDSRDSPPNGENL